MKYIISPSWFYWLGVVDKLKILFIGLVAGGLCIAAIMLCIAHIDYEPEDREHKYCMRFATIAICVAMLGLIGYMFIPDKATLIEMQVARYATYDNAQWTIESIKSIVDYIIDAIKAVR